jgi:hypothetical protein
MTRYRTITASITLLLCAALAACSSNALSAAAKAESAISLACSSAFTITTQAQTSGLISLADATAVVNVLLTVEQANQQAEMATAAIAAAPTTAGLAGLPNILAPVSTALTNAINGGFVGIKDAGTKQKIILALTTAQTVLTGAIAIIGAVKS